MCRTNRLGLRLPRAYKEALRRLAAEEGEPMSAILRRLIRQEVRQRNVLPKGCASAEQNDKRKGGR